MGKRQIVKKLLCKKNILLLFGVLKESNGCCYFFNKEANDNKEQQARKIREERTSKFKPKFGSSLTLGTENGIKDIEVVSLLQVIGLQYQEKKIISNYKNLCYNTSWNLLNLEIREIIKKISLDKNIDLLMGKVKVLEYKIHVQNKYENQKQDTDFTITIKKEVKARNVLDIYVDITELAKDPNKSLVGFFLTMDAREDTIEKDVDKQIKEGHCDALFTGLQEVYQASIPKSVLSESLCNRS